MTTTPTNWRALCAELLNHAVIAQRLLVGEGIWDYGGEIEGDGDEDEGLFDRARTALAQPESEAPTDKELLELMPKTMRDEFAAVSEVYSTATGGQVKPGLFRVVLNTVALEYARAVHAAAQHLTTIEPVPVADCPWERKGWCDSEGKCWWWIVDQPGEFPHWIYAPIEAMGWSNYQACLPHYALQMPNR